MKNQVNNTLTLHPFVAVLVSLDLEHWSRNTTNTTEVGLSIFNSRDLRRVVASLALGPHGEHLLQTGRFYHFRISQNTHMIKDARTPGAKVGGVFGQTRFASQGKMNAILDRLFHQPIQGVPELQGCYRPIVVLGHDISHDLKNLRENSIRFDLNAADHVVKFIDTQRLVRDTGEWMPPVRSNNIGLRKLIESYNFSHDGAHDAAVDAARTAVCAIQILLKHFAKSDAHIWNDCHKAKTDTSKSMQQVASDLEVYSRNNFVEIGGSVLYCSTCGSTAHMEVSCPNIGSLHCGYCAFQNRPTEASTHVEMHCTWRADQGAAQKRVDDQIAKRARTVKAQRPRGGHLSGRGNHHRPLDPSRGDDNLFYPSHSRWSSSDRKASYGRSGERGNSLIVPQRISPLPIEQAQSPQNRNSGSHSDTQYHARSLAEHSQNSQQRGEATAQNDGERPGTTSFPSNHRPSHPGDHNTAWDPYATVNPVYDSSH